VLIQYCDACSVRVDEDECVQVGDQTYCKACAATRAPKRANTSGLRTATKTNTVPPSAAVRHTPGSGLRQVVPSSARSAPQRSGTSQAHTAARGGSGSSARNPAASESNRLIILALLGAGVLLAGAGAVLLFSSRGNKETKKVETPGVESKEQPKKSAELKPVDQTKPAQQKKESAEAVPLPKASIGTEMEDIREGSAQRELDRLKDFEKRGNANPFELRRRYEKFVASQGSTKAGKEAAERLKSLEQLAARPPDNVAKATAGVSATMYEADDDDLTLSTISLTNRQLVKSAVVPTVDFPNKDSIRNAFGRTDKFVLEFTGCFDVTRDGTYTFYLNSDDGSVMFIGDTLFIANEGKHPMKEESSSIPLKPGKHNFRVLLWQRDGDVGVSLSWSGPELDKQTLPQNVLFHPDK
jgi:hypothetical protein